MDITYEITPQTEIHADVNTGGNVPYVLPPATSSALGGVKADPKTASDTQPVRIGTDGKLYTAPTAGGSTVTVTPLVTQGTHIADIEVDGVNKEIYAPDNTETLQEINEHLGMAFENLADAIIYAITKVDNTVFLADFSGAHPLESQFRTWAGRVYSGRIFDTIENIECSNDTLHLKSTFDTVQDLWITQLLTTAGIFESDDFTCSFKAKFDGAAGSWQNVITYGTGTYWTNKVYSDGVKWSAGGEIDVFEQAGGYADTPNVFYTPTAHFGSGTESGYIPTHEYETGNTVQFTTDVWHDFKFSLKEGYVTVWVDNVKVGERDFSNHTVSNNYLYNYKPFTKPQAFYLDGQCATNEQVDKTHTFDFAIREFKITQQKGNVECLGLSISPQMFGVRSGIVYPVGAEIFFDKTFTPADTSNKACSWVSSNESVATVVQGYVKFVGVGSTTITAQCGNAVATYELTCSVNASVPCVGLKMNINEVISSDTDILIWKYPNYTTEAVTITSSDTSVATIENGKIIPLLDGTTTITVLCGEHSASVDVTVTGHSNVATPYVNYDLSLVVDKYNSAVEQFLVDKVNVDIDIKESCVDCEVIDETTVLEFRNTSGWLQTKFNPKNTIVPASTNRVVFVGGLREAFETLSTDNFPLQFNFAASASTSFTPYFYKGTDNLWKIWYTSDRGLINVPFSDIPNYVMFVQDSNGFLMHCDGADVQSIKRGSDYYRPFDGMNGAICKVGYGNSQVIPLEILNNLKVGVFLGDRTLIPKIKNFYGITD